MSFNSIVFGAELWDSTGSIHAEVGQSHPLPIFRLLFPARFSTESCGRHAVPHIFSPYTPCFASIHNAPARAFPALTLVVLTPNF
jgi:hypothetical protein